METGKWLKFIPWNHFHHTHFLVTTLSSLNKHLRMCQMREDEPGLSFWQIEFETDAETVIGLNEKSNK